MKNMLLMMLTALTAYSANAIEITESKLEAQELASFHKIQNKSFVVEQVSKNEDLAFWVSLYVDGKEYSESVNIVVHDNRPQMSSKSHKVSIMYQDQGETFKVVVSHDNASNSSDVMKPKGVRISGFTHGVEFDDNGRLVLGYDVSPNDKGEVRISPESTKPENAKSALVFNLLQVSKEK
jgi:hypothetical protein